MLGKCSKYRKSLQKVTTFLKTACAVSNKRAKIKIWLSGLCDLFLKLMLEARMYMHERFSFPSTNLLQYMTNKFFHTKQMNYNRDFTGT